MWFNILSRTRFSVRGLFTPLSKTPPLIISKSFSATEEQWRNRVLISIYNYFQVQLFASYIPLSSKEFRCSRAGFGWQTICTHFCTWVWGFSNLDLQFLRKNVLYREDSRRKHNIPGNDNTSRLGTACRQVFKVHCFEPFTTTMLPQERQVMRKEKEEKWLGFMFWEGGWSWVLGSNRQQKSQCGWRGTVLGLVSGGKLDKLCTHHPTDRMEAWGCLCPCNVIISSKKLLLRKRRV